MLSQKQVETLEALSTLRKQVELLDSHRNVGMIKEKQYQQSLAMIMAKIEAIEEEYGLEPYIFTAEELLYSDNPIFR